MKELAVTLGTILLVMGIAANAFAYRGGSGGMSAGYGYAIDDRMAASLNLTAEQTAQIRSLREVQLKEIQPLQNKLYSKRSELKLLWLQQSPDEGKIKAIDQEIRSLRDQLQDKRTGHRLAIFKILTPEQQTKLQAYAAGRGSGSGRGMRGQGGMGMAPEMGQGMGMRGR
jgi:Spy/CpxP family protein refolding chaperone